MNLYKFYILLTFVLPLQLRAQEPSPEALKAERKELSEKTRIYESISDYVTEDFGAVLKDEKRYDNTEYEALHKFIGAQAAFRKQQFNEAKINIDACLAIEPKNEIALELAVEIARKIENASAVEAYLQSLVALKPNDEELLLSLIDFYDGTRNHKSAENYAEQLAKQNGKQKEISYYRARVLISNGIYEPASDLLYSALEKEFFIPSFELLYRLESINKNGEKLSLLKDSAPKTYVQSLDFLVLNLPLLVENNEYNTIIKMFDTLSNADIQYAERMLDYPSIFLSDEAVAKKVWIQKYFDRLELVMGKNDPRLALSKANLALVSNNCDEALEQYIIFTQAPPVELTKVLDVSNYLSELCPSNSFIFLKSFEEYFPESSLLYTAMAKSLMANENIEEAEVYLKKSKFLLFDFSGADYKEYLKAQFQWFARANMPNDFSALIEQNLSTFSEGGEFLMLCAYHVRLIYPDPNTAKEALNSLLKKSNDKKEDVFVHALQALFYLDIQNTKRAENALDEAEKVNANALPFLLAKAEYYRFVGDTRRAKKFYEKALELDPSFTYISLLLEKLS